MTALTSRPWDNTPISTETEWGDYMKWTVPSGVLLESLNSLEVYGDSTGRQVKMRAGKVMNKGVYGVNVSEQTISLTTNGAGNSRIDRIVLRNDYNTNSMDPVVITGTAAGTPQAPAIGANDVLLAQVLLASGYTTVAAGDVTDERNIAAGLDGQTGSEIRLYDNTLTGSTASWDVSGIPQSFRDLKVRILGRTDRASTFDFVAFRANNDSTGIYDTVFGQVEGDGTAAYAFDDTDNQTSGKLGSLTGASAAANFGGSFVAFLPDYTDKLFHHTWYQIGAMENTNDPVWNECAGSFTFATLAGVNRLTIFPNAGTNFVTGSRLTITGVR